MLLNRFLFVTVFLSLFAACRAAAGVVPVTLSSDNPRATFALPVEKSGETYFLFEAAAPGASWARPKGRAAVLKVCTKGTECFNVVIHGGENKLEYSAYAGSPPPGALEVSVEIDPLLSRADSAPVTILSARLRTVGPDDPDYCVYKLSPIIAPRDGKADSDIPIAVYSNPPGASDTIELVFQTVFSNEDGGTGASAPVLMVQWGRTTDIEWTYHVTADRRTCEAVSEKFQSKGHGVTPFTGLKIGGHPILTVTTTNNNFNQLSGGPAIALIPDIFDQGAGTREVFLDRRPWLHRVANEEMYAENKAVKSAIGVAYKLGDARNYLYIDYNALNPSSERNIVVEAVLDNGKTYSTDPGFPVPFVKDSGMIHFSGVKRTAIQLPPGISPERIKTLRFIGTPGALLEVYGLKLFFLDENYSPKPAFFESAKKVTLGLGGTTAEVPIR